MIVVSDASPIIGLAAVGELDLLRQLYGAVHIPQAVYEEIVAGEAGPGAYEIRTMAWIQIAEVRDIPLVQALSVELDVGEAEAIALAVEMNADLVLIDERRGRRVARRHHQTVIGVLGVLVEAKRQGAVPAVKPLLDALHEAAGCHVAQELRARVLEVTGET